MHTEYLAESAMQDRRAEIAKFQLSQEALALGSSPNFLRWTWNWAIEPWTQPSRSRKARSTSGQSLSTME